MFSKLQDKLSRMCDMYSFLFEQQVLSRTWVHILGPLLCDVFIHGRDWTYFPKTIGPLSPIPCKLIIPWMWHSSSWEEAVSVSSPSGRVHYDFWGWVIKDNPASTFISFPALLLNLVWKGQNTCCAGRAVRWRVPAGCPGSAWKLSGKGGVAGFFTIPSPCFQSSLPFTHSWCQPSLIQGEGRRGRGDKGAEKVLGVPSGGLWDA